MYCFCFPLVVRKGFSRPHHQLKSQIRRRSTEYFSFSSTFCYALNTAGIKSSLRRPSAPAPSSPWSERRPLDISASDSKSQDNSVNQDSSRSSSPVWQLPISKFFRVRVLVVFIYQHLFWRLTPEIGLSSNGVRVQRNQWIRISRGGDQPSWRKGKKTSG